MSDPHVIDVDARHSAFLDELKACLGSAGKDLPAEHLLAVTSQFLGMLIAAQDRRTMTHDQAMSIVVANIETGNATAVEGLLGSRLTAG